MAYISYKDKFINIPDELVGKLELVNDISKLTQQDIDKVVKELLEESEDLSEILQDNTIRFKLFAKDIAKGYREAVDSEIESLTDVWDSCEQQRKNVYEKTSEIKKSIELMKRDVTSLKEAINSLDFYRIDKILELVRTFNNLNESDKKLFTMVVSNIKMD